MHTVLRVQHERRHAAGHHAREQGDAVPFLFGPCAQHSGRELTVVPNQHQLAASSHQRHEDGSLRGLRGLVDEDAIEGHGVQDVTTGPDACAAHDLRLLELPDALLVGHLPATAAVIAGSVDAVSQQFRSDGFGTSQPHHAQTNARATFHKVIHGDVGIRRCQDGRRIAPLGNGGRRQARPVLQDADGNGGLSATRRTLHESEAVACGTLHGQALGTIQTFQRTVLVQCERRLALDGVLIQLVLTVLVVETPRHAFGAKGSRGRHFALAHVLGLAHELVDVLIHRRDGLDEQRARPLRVSGLHDAPFVTRDGACDCNGSRELTVEAHAVGELVDTVHIAIHIFRQHLMQLHVGLVLKPQHHGIRVAHGGLDHAPIQALGGQRVRAGVREQRHGIACLDATVLHRIGHEYAELFAWHDDELRCLLASLQPRVHDANCGPHESLARRGADAIACGHHLLQKLQRDAAHDTKEVRSAGRRVEVRGDAKGVDHVRRAVGAAVAKILRHALQDAFRLRCG
mmetsp:Transcript_25938/g.72366  ORF Transcript_25938/g.72366 Transcript_25938/m.72366 type:complete len:515 (+) Transcript_25938:1330-2874(+)